MVKNSCMCCPQVNWGASGCESPPVAILVVKHGVATGAMFIWVACPTSQAWAAAGSYVQMHGPSAARICTDIHGVSNCWRLCRWWGLAKCLSLCWCPRFARTGVMIIWMACAATRSHGVIWSWAPAVCHVCICGPTAVRFWSDVHDLFYSRAW